MQSLNLLLWRFLSTKVTKRETQPLQASFPERDRNLGTKLAYPSQTSVGQSVEENAQGLSWHSF